MNSLLDAMVATRSWLSAKRPVHRTSSLRDAFTLLEIILVLTILAVIGAIAVPGIGESFQRHKLQAAIQDLRSEWERARLTAMKTGQTQAFTCVAGTNQYSVAPYLTQSDATEGSAGATLVVGGTLAESQVGGGITAPDPTAATGTKSLDNELLFVGCVVSTDMRAISVTQAQGGMTADGAVNQMVLFYPDGTTSTAELTIQNLRGDARCVRMRGLTGHAQIFVLPAVAPAVPGSNLAAAPTT